MDIKIEDEKNKNILNDLKNFLNDLSEIFERNLIDGNKNVTDDNFINPNEAYKIIEKFKFKYENFTLDKWNKQEKKEFKSNLVKLLSSIFNSYSSTNNLNLFFEMMLDFFEYLPKLYDTEEFDLYSSANIKYLIDDDDDNSKNLKDLFFSIGNKYRTEYPSTEFHSINFHKILSDPNSELNEFLDTLIIYLVDNSDPKILFVSNNILTKYKNISTFLSFKLIFINIMILRRLNMNYKFFTISLSNIADFLLPESILFGRKLNEELFENKFSDFDYEPNSNSEKRKLNSLEFEFLINNLFPLINYITQILQFEESELIKFSSKSTSSDLSLKENKISLVKLVENSIESGKTKCDSLKEINIYRNYLILCFISDCFEFIFSNLHYLDSKFRLEENIKINTNPFEVFQEKIRPKFYDKFIENTINFIRKNFCSNLIDLIEIYLMSCEIKNSKLEKINELEKNEDGTYFIYEPFNSIGFPLIIWLLWKENHIKIFPSVYSPTYILDVFLPLSSALIKRGQNFRMMGIELLFDLIELNSENSIEKLSQINFYSLEDVFKDLLEFIGGPDMEIKRIYVTKNLNKIIKILSDGAKKDLFLGTLKEILKENKESINDAQASFVIYTLKNILSECIRQNKSEKSESLFDPIFLKDIVKISVNKDLFVIDILETISQGLNFLHFVLVKDKNIFNGKMTFYNKEYLRDIDKDIDIIAKLIQKWINSNDEEKMKHVKIDTSELGYVSSLSEKREEFKKGFELRKNQAMLALNMIDNVEKLIRNCLNSLS